MPAERRVVRTALGAGKWFPDDRRELAEMVSHFIDEAEPPPVKGRVLGIVAPHAGYFYSGATAGYAYRAVRDSAATGTPPETVVVLGFSHRGSFRGVALMDGAAFATPLGEVRLDEEAAALLTTDPRIVRDYKPHVGEHSAENQVPFVQTALPGAALVLALIGSHDSAIMDATAALLDKLARKKSLLVVASSDMLHDPNYERVRKTDQATLRKLVALDVNGILAEWDFSQQVFCGIAPVASTVKYARQQGCTAGTVLRYRNSGDDHPESRGQWVVGYSAVAFAACTERESGST